MKYIGLIIFILLLGLSVNSQVLYNIKYYADQNKMASATEQNAKYVEYNWINYDSSITTNFVSFESRRLIRTESNKNLLPSGIWRYYDENGKLIKVLDYDFDLVYNKKPSDSIFYFDLASKRLSIDGEFEPPIFSKGDFAFYITENLQYPESAAINGFYGKVKVLFVINEDGSISNVSILKGIHKILDQEAMRVIRSMPHWEPAVYNGKKIKVYTYTTLSFSLK